MAKKKAKTKPKRPHGRPTKYTEALAAEICERLSLGESLNRICKDDHMPTEPCVLDWVDDDREGFSLRYVRARERQADAYANQIMAIADDPDEDVQRSKLRVDARKWVAARLLPRTWGDRTAVDIKGEATITVQVIDMDAGKRQAE